MHVVRWRSRKSSLDSVWVLLGGLLTPSSSFSLSLEIATMLSAASMICTRSDATSATCWTGGGAIEPLVAGCAVGKGTGGACIGALGLGGIALGSAGASLLPEAG
eukprot:6474955-Amphidinium_carterae.1